MPKQYLRTISGRTTTGWRGKLQQQRNRASDRTLPVDRLFGVHRWTAAQPRRCDDRAQQEKLSSTSFRNRSTVRHFSPLSSPRWWSNRATIVDQGGCAWPQQQYSKLLYPSAAPVTPRHQGQHAAWHVDQATNTHLYRNEPSFEALACSNTGSHEALNKRVVYISRIVWISSTSVVACWPGEVQHPGDFRRREKKNMHPQAMVAVVHLACLAVAHNTASTRVHLVNAIVSSLSF